MTTQNLKRVVITGIGIVSDRMDTNRGNGRFVTSPSVCAMTGTDKIKQANKKIKIRMCSLYPILQKHDKTV